MFNTIFVFICLLSVLVADSMVGHGAAIKCLDNGAKSHHLSSSLDPSLDHLQPLTTVPKHAEDEPEGRACPAYGGQQ